MWNRLETVVTPIYCFLLKTTKISLSILGAQNTRWPKYHEILSKTIPFANFFQSVFARNAKKYKKHKKHILLYKQLLFCWKPCGFKVFSVAAAVFSIFFKMHFVERSGHNAAKIQEKTWIFTFFEKTCFFDGLRVSRIKKRFLKSGKHWNLSPFCNFFKIPRIQKGDLLTSSEFGGGAFSFHMGG